MVMHPITHRVSTNIHEDGTLELELEDTVRAVCFW